MTVRVPGASPKVLRGLKHAPEFKTIACVVIMSLTDGPSEFYLDNLTFRTAEKP